MDALIEKNRLYICFWTVAVQCATVAVQRPPRTNDKTSECIPRWETTTLAGVYATVKKLWTADTIIVEEEETTKFLYIHNCCTLRMQRPINVQSERGTPIILTWTRQRSWWSAIRWRKTCPMTWKSQPLRRSPPATRWATSPTLLLCLWAWNYYRILLWPPTTGRWTETNVAPGSSHPWHTEENVSYVGTESGGLITIR